MFDIHSHIIHGVDDGAPDLETSTALIRMAAATGTRHIINTSHVIELNNHPSWERIKSGVAELQAIADSEQLDLKIYPGSEVEMNWDILEALKESDHSFCLAGTRYQLVELPAMMIPDYAEDFWYELQLAGRIPVLAHPERNEVLMHQPERLLKWMRSGLLTQCNGGSLLGKFGERAQRHAELLLKNGLIYFIGSDAHRVKVRNTDLTDARLRLEELVGREKAEAICTLNPQKLLADEIIEPQVPDKLVWEERRKKKQGFWSRLFG